MGTTIRQTHFEAIPTGTYPAVVGAAELGEGQYGSQVKIRFDFTGDLSGRAVMGWASASFGGKSKLTGWVKAILFGGMEVPPDYDLDLDHLLDKPCMVTVIEREGDDGGTFNRIDGVKPQRGIGSGGGQLRPSASSGTIPQRAPVTAASVRNGAPPPAQRSRASGSNPNEPPDWPGWEPGNEPPY